MTITETTPDLYRRLAAALTERVDAVPTNRWDSPSPCDAGPPATWSTTSSVRRRR